MTAADFISRGELIKPNLAPSDREKSPSDSFMSPDIENLWKMGFKYALDGYICDGAEQNVASLRVYLGIGTNQCVHNLGSLS